MWLFLKNRLSKNHILLLFFSFLTIVSVFLNVFCLDYSFLFSENVSCTEQEYRCPSDGRCIPERWQCDGEEDCEDKTDEGPEICRKKKKLFLFVIVLLFLSLLFLSIRKPTR